MEGWVFMVSESMLEDEDFGKMNFDSGSSTSGWRLRRGIWAENLATEIRQLSQQTA